jgi:hypothetical protein
VAAGGYGYGHVAPPDERWDDNGRLAGGVVGQDPPLFCRPGDGVVERPVPGGRHYEERALDEPRDVIFANGTALQLHDAIGAHGLQAIREFGADHGHFGR